jgi:hypothetical protein
LENQERINDSESSPIPSAEAHQWREVEGVIGACWLHSVPELRYLGMPELRDSPAQPFLRQLPGQRAGKGCSQSNESFFLWLPSSWLSSCPPPVPVDWPFASRQHFSGEFSWLISFKVLTSLSPKKEAKPRGFLFKVTRPSRSWGSHSAASLDS